MTQNITELLSQHVRSGNAAPAQRFATPAGWVTRSFGDLFDLSNRVAGFLADSGVSKGDRVAILLPTRADWTVVDLAAARLGAPLVPIYPTSAPAQLLDIVERARPAVLVVARSYDLPAGLPTDVMIVRVGDLDGDLGDLEPAPFDSTSPRDEQATEVTADDLFTISFSSGSTGVPKGCLLTHGNYIAVLGMAVAAESHPERGMGHRTAAFVYLPLAHSSARLQQLTTLVAGGELVYGSGDTAAILEQIAETRPTYVPGVPRLFESAYLRAGRHPGRLRVMFGDRLVYALTGGAPIAPEMLATYERAGIALVEGYGLTETATAIAIAAPHSNRPGTVGLPLPGLEIRIARDGEILVAGPNVFRGYLDDPAATAAAFVEGWFHTGDLGSIDADGFLSVTGRKKNLIVTSTGKNVAPEPAENVFRQACAIDSVVVVGEARPFIAAVVTTGTYAVDDSELVAAALAVNATLSPPEWIRKIAVVDATLSVEAGELTASGKVVRQVVLDRFAEVIDDLYSSGRNDAGLTPLRLVDVVPRGLRAVS